MDCGGKEKKKMLILGILNKTEYWNNSEAKGKG